MKRLKEKSRSMMLCLKLKKGSFLTGAMKSAGRRVKREKKKSYAQDAASLHTRITPSAMSIIFIRRRCTGNMLKNQKKGMPKSASVESAEKIPLKVRSFAKNI